MIKVIGRDANKAKREVCKSCGSILEFYPADEKVVEVQDYLGDSYNYRAIHCPECEHEVVVLS